MSWSYYTSNPKWKSSQLWIKLGWPSIKVLPFLSSINYHRFECLKLSQVNHGKIIYAYLANIKIRIFVNYDLGQKFPICVSFSWLCCCLKWPEYFHLNCSRLLPVWNGRGGASHPLLNAVNTGGLCWRDGE